MAVQFIFGGSGRGKTYFLQHKIMGEAVKNPKKDYICSRKAITQQHHENKHLQ